MRKTLIAAAVALATTPLVGIGTAAAETEISANVGFVTDYRFRGISQTARKPALQGGFDLEHASGAYAGIWGSNISWLSDAGAENSSVEIDYYGGYAGEIGDFFYDLSLVYYSYPSGRIAGEPNPNTTEAYLTGGWGPVSLTYVRSFTNLFGFESSKGSHYLMAAFEYEIMDNLSLDAHIGRQKVKGPDGGSYTDYGIGVTYAAGGFDIGLHYVDTNSSSFLKEDGVKIRDAKGTAILSISRTF